MDELDLGDEFYFQWHLTERCNLRCRHCYHESYSRFHELPVGELLAICEQIENALRVWGKTGSVSLTGGEPLVRRDCLQAVMEGLDHSDHVGYYDLLTNGTLLTNDDIRSLGSREKLRRVQVSLESPRELDNDQIRGHGVYAKVIDAISRLKDASLAVSVMMTLTQQNLAQIEEMIELLAATGVDTLALERFIPEGSGALLEGAVLGREQVQSAFIRIHELGTREKRLRVLMHRPLFALIDGEDPTVGACCSVGTNALTIMNDGVIFPCRRLPIPIGNVLEGGIFQAWYESELLWTIRESRNLRGNCGKCELVPVCRGCRAMAHFLTGDLLGEDPHCWKNQARSMC